MATAVPQREETAVLCSIPETAPYWVSPEDVNECNLVQLNNNIGTWATYLNRGALLPLHYLSPSIYDAVVHRSEQGGVRP